VSWVSIRAKVRTWPEAAWSSGRPSASNSCTIVWCRRARSANYHLDYQTLRAHLREIRAQRVVLTHMSAAMLSRLADAELPAAYDGMTIDL
jgi:hypothetical protein